MEKNSDIRKAAYASLEGKWGKFAGMTLVYFLIYYSASFVGGLAIGFANLGSPARIQITSNVMSIIIGIAALPLAWSFLVLFLRNLRNEANLGVGNLFDGYKDFSRIMLTMLLQGIYTFLWSLLLLIPGIVKSYSYSMTGYILRDKPELQYDAAIERSMKLMDGHKAKLFLLDLSFIGWFLLGILTFGIGLLWVYPYWSSARSAFYENLLRDEAQSAGYAAESPVHPAE